MARSASHHQLLAQARQPLLAPYLGRLAEPESELDAAELLGAPMRPYRGAPAAAYLADPKAIEFNQYLLEQHELGLGAERALSSDDDEPAYPGPAAPGGSGLTRSRSCILAGPSAPNKAGLAARKHDLAKVGATSGSSSWDLSAGRAAP